jgi:hypothetical protein
VASAITGFLGNAFHVAANPIMPSFGFDESETVNVSGHGSSTDFGLSALI